MITRERLRKIEECLFLGAVAFIGLSGIILVYSLRPDQFVGGL